MSAEHPDDPPSPPATAQEIRDALAAELRRLRELAEFTQDTVATDFDWSPSKIGRIESGASKVQISDLRMLLPHYGVTDTDTVESLVAMARAARGTHPAVGIPSRLKRRPVAPTNAVRFDGPTAADCFTKATAWLRHHTSTHAVAAVIATNIEYPREGGCVLTLIYNRTDPAPEDEGAR